METEAPETLAIGKPFHPLKWLARQQQQQTKQQEMQIDLKILNKWKQKIIYKNQGSLWKTFVAGAKTWKSREKPKTIISFLRLGRRLFFSIFGNGLGTTSCKKEHNKIFKY